MQVISLDVVVGGEMPGKWPHGMSRGGGQEQGPWGIGGGKLIRSINVRVFWINIITMSLRFRSIYFIVLEAHSNQLKTSFWALLFHAGASLQKKLHNEPQVLSDATQPEHL